MIHTFEVLERCSRGAEGRLDQELGIERFGPLWHHVQVVDVVVVEPKKPVP